MFSSIFTKAATAAPVSKPKEILITSTVDDANKFDCGFGSFIDDSKSTFIIAHAHKLSAENPESTITYIYSDSRVDAIVSLKYLFMLHPDLLPGNVALSLQCTAPHYNKLITDQPIQGTGKLAANPMEYVKRLVQCAGFDTALDTKQPWDVASHLRMKNELNLKKFKELCDMKSCLQTLDAEITFLATHEIHSKHGNFEHLHKALRELRKNVAADIETSEKTISAEKIMISPSAHIAQETLNLLKNMRSHTSNEKEEIKRVVHQYESNCKKILGEDTYLSSINYYLFAPAQLSKDIDAIIKNAKIVLELEAQQVQQSGSGYKYIPFMK